MALPINADDLIHQRKAERTPLNTSQTGILNLLSIPSRHLRIPAASARRENRVFWAGKFRQILPCRPLDQQPFRKVLMIGVWEYPDACCR